MVKPAGTCLYEKRWLCWIRVRSPVQPRTIDQHTAARWPTNRRIALIHDDAGNLHKEEERSRKARIAFHRIRIGENLLDDNADHLDTQYSLAFSVASQDNTVVLAFTDEASTGRRSRVHVHLVLVEDRYPAGPTRRHTA